MIMDRDSSGSTSKSPSLAADEVDQKKEDKAEAVTPSKTKSGSNVATCLSCLVEIAECLSCCPSS